MRQSEKKPVQRRLGNDKLLICQVVTLAFLLGSRLMAQPVLTSCYRGTGSGALVWGPGAVWGNPAGSGTEQSLQLALYCADRFMIKDLAAGGVAALIPAGKGMLSILAQQSGRQLFKHQYIMLGYAARMSRGLHAGIRLLYDHLCIGENYGQASGTGAVAGFQYAAGKDWITGASISFLRMPALYPEKAFVFSSAWAFGWKLSGNLLLYGEVEKSEALQPRAKLGIQCRFPSGLFCQGRMGLGPSNSLLGFGWEKGKYMVQIETSYQSLLGFSPSLALLFTPGKK
ncbi:MAG TPA: hypothetical protein P5531_05990 [Bacteroidales bacterium]|nr:hypothetical protein [Bacteroidales bacterium]HSA42959.1 hypothetical protein [Bacteroidales bacterium]